MGVFFLVLCPKQDYFPAQIPNSLGKQKLQQNHTSNFHSHVSLKTTWERSAYSTSFYCWVYPVPDYITVWWWFLKVIYLFQFSEQHKLARNILFIPNTTRLGKRFAVIKAIISSGLCKNIYDTWVETHSRAEVQGGPGKVTSDTKRPLVCTVSQFKGQGHSWAV